MSPPPVLPAAVAAPEPLAAGLARGVVRLLAEHGYACLTEYGLGNGRRADVAGMDRGGAIVIVEIKSSLEDYRADRKWSEYLGFCDRFYFAVPDGFPRAVLPAEHGLMVADPYGAAILREAPSRALHPSRRKAQTLRFARTAARRRSGLIDPPAVRGPAGD